VWTTYDPGAGFFEKFNEPSRSRRAEISWPAEQLSSYEGFCHLDLVERQWFSWQQWGTKMKLQNKSQKNTSLFCRLFNDVWTEETVWYPRLKREEQSQKTTISRHYPCNDLQTKPVNLCTWHLSNEIRTIYRTADKPRHEQGIS
jgi:hypothetical protein